MPRWEGLRKVMVAFPPEWEGLIRKRMKELGCGTLNEYLRLLIRRDLGLDKDILQGGEGT